MPMPLLIGAAIATGIAGTAVQMIGQQKAAEAQKRQIELEMKAEAERKKLMEADARKRMLEMVRAQQRARSQSLATATAQGAEGGSALPGAYGQIAGQTNTNVFGVATQLEVGRNLFDINQGISMARIDMADANTMTAMGGGIKALGQDMLNVAQPLGRITRGLNPYEYRA